MTRGPHLTACISCWLQWTPSQTGHTHFWPTSSLTSIPTKPQVTWELKLQLAHFCSFHSIWQNYFHIIHHWGSKIFLFECSVSQILSSTHSPSWSQSCLFSPHRQSHLHFVTRTFQNQTLYTSISPSWSLRWQHSTSSVLDCWVTSLSVPSPPSKASPWDLQITFRYIHALPIYF